MKAAKPKPPPIDATVQAMRAEAVYAAMLYEAAMAGRLQTFNLEVDRLLYRCAAQFTIQPEIA